MTDQTATLPPRPSDAAQAQNAIHAAAIAALRSRLRGQPDVPVRPTIADVRAGRDEVLDGALRYLERSLPKTSTR